MSRNNSTNRDFLVGPGLHDLILTSARDRAGSTPAITTTPPAGAFHPTCSPSSTAPTAVDHNGVT
ncbi:hypothetical protein ACQPYE_13455 [Actinosynnema sp. CA-299493]